jgi:hypothetical protein
MVIKQSFKDKKQQEKFGRETSWKMSKTKMKSWMELKIVASMGLRTNCVKT